MSLSLNKERWAYILKLPYLIQQTCRTNESLKREICPFWINNRSQNDWLQEYFYRKIYASTLLCAIDTMDLGAMHMEREYLKLLDGTILRAQLHTCHTWHKLRIVSYSMIQKHRGDYAASYPTIPGSLNALVSSNYILPLQKPFIHIIFVNKTFVMSLRITLCTSS